MSFSDAQMTLALSPEHIEWNSLCGLINRNWPRHAELIDTAMAETDRDVVTAGGDPEVASEYPAYYGNATVILRGLLTLALGIS